jgi:predicted SnoaL-like aldol condensation-catalyzing enzyme
VHTEEGERQWSQIHIVRISGGQIVEHWAVRDDLRVARRPGGSPGSG